MTTATITTHKTPVKQAGRAQSEMQIVSIDRCLSHEIRCEVRVDAHIVESTTFNLRGMDHAQRTQTFRQAVAWCQVNTIKHQ